MRTLANRETYGWSLRALFGLSIVLPLSLFAWTAWSSYGEELVDAERTAVRTVTALREHAVKVLDTHELVLNEVDRWIEGRPWDDIESDGDLRAELARIERSMDQITAISLIDGQGRVRLTTIQHPQNVTVEGRDQLQAQQQQDAGTYVSAPYTGKLLGERVIALGKRRTTPDGSFEGIVQVVVPVSYLTSFWEQFAPTIAHIIPLVRADGQVIARYPALNNPERLDPAGPFLGRALRQPQGVYTAVSQVDGIERLNAYERIKDYPLFISFSIETRAILARWYEAMLLHGIYTLLAVAALIGATAVAMRQYRAQLDASQRWQEAADRLSAEMAAREKAEEALRQSQKMEAVGQITAGVAHDFNNLLQALTSNLYLLSTRVPQDARVFTDAGMQAVERGSKLVQQLMAFSRRQRLKPQPVDLHALISGMGDLLQKAVGEGICIEVEVDRDVHPVMVDPTQTELAILNLAINARDAMTGGGRITVTTRNVEVRQGDGTDLGPGDYVVLSVSDTGCGMTPEVQARAFDPFFTTKEVGKGTGLGLSMVHGFANQSGGGVDLESRPGRGTTIRLYVPRADVAPQAERRSSGVAASASDAARILLVDDDALGRMATALALRELGYHVHEARNGGEALTALERETPVDLLVTDYAMPGMNGVELAASARRAYPGIKVMMMTGHAASAFDDENADISAALRKPFRMEELAERVRGALDAGRPRANIIDFQQVRRR